MDGAIWINFFFTRDSTSEAEANMVCLGQRKQGEIALSLFKPLAPMPSTLKVSEGCQPAHQKRGVIPIT